MFAAEVKTMKHRATVICQRGKHILLVAKEGARWALPGGRQRLDETLAETAVRELEEETTLLATEVTYLFLFTGSRTRHSVFVAHIAWDAFPVPTNEIARCHWVLPEELKHLPASVPTKGIAELFSRHARREGRPTFSQAINDLSTE